MSDDELKEETPDEEEETIEYYVPFAKNTYKVPGDAIVFNKERPINIDAAASMGFIETKKKVDWEASGLVFRNIIVLHDSETKQRSWYVTFQVGDASTHDPFILRQVPKELAAKWSEEWAEGWDDAKKARYEELLGYSTALVPVSPKALGWTQISSKSIKTAYVKEKKEAAPRSKKRPAESDGDASTSTAPATNYAVGPDSVVLPRDIYEAMARAYHAA